MNVRLAPLVAILGGACLLVLVAACSDDATCEGEFTKCGTLCCTTCAADGTSCAGAKSGPGIEPSNSFTSSSSGASTTGPVCNTQSGGPPRKTVVTSPECGGMASRRTYCDGACVDVTLDRNNCGGCGNVCCPDESNLPGSCSQGVCR